MWDPKIDAVWARLVVADLVQRGFDRKTVLNRVGISERDLEVEGGRVSIAKDSALFEHAAQLSGDDLYGLKFGLNTDPRESGLLAYLGLSSATLIDAIRNLARYLRVISDQHTLTLEDRPDGLMVCAHGDSLAEIKARQSNEAGIVSLLVAYRLFSARNITPIEVHFRHSRTTNLSAFNKAFGCPVVFQSNKTSLLLKRVDMNIPLASADDRLLRVLRSYCEEILSKRRTNSAPFLSDVNAKIIDLFPKGTANAKTVAAELGLSPRTFLRRLKEENTTFQALLDELRLELAETYLAEPHLNAKEIAFLLGYSDSSSFNHSFRRLSGTSPGEYRSQQVNAS